MASFSIYATELEKPTSELGIDDTCYIQSTKLTYRAISDTEWQLDTTNSNTNTPSTIIPIGTSPPSAPTTGMLWVDTN